MNMKKMTIAILFVLMFLSGCSMQNNSSYGYTEGKVPLSFLEGYHHADYDDLISVSGKESRYIWLEGIIEELYSTDEESYRNMTVLYDEDGHKMNVYMEKELSESIEKLADYYDREYALTGVYQNETDEDGIPFLYITGAFDKSSGMVVNVFEEIANAGSEDSETPEEVKLFADDLVLDDRWVINEGEVKYTKLQVFPVNSGYSAEYSSSDENVVTIDNQGVVYAVSPGVAVLSVQCGGLYDEMEVEVTDYELAQAEVSRNLEVSEADGLIETFVFNVSSKIFHKPTCHLLPTKNRMEGDCTRQEAIDKGYNPCKRCKP